MRMHPFLLPHGIPQPPPPVRYLNLLARKKESAAVSYGCADVWFYGFRSIAVKDRFFCSSWLSSLPPAYPARPIGERAVVRGLD